jgi:CO/xanthine dehydrogenase Mo-binding subunit
MASTFRLPGMKFATLAQSPVFGGRVKSVDDAAAKAVKGVRQIVRLDDAVAVLDDHMGAARKVLATSVIEWDDGPHAKLNSDEIAREPEKATLNSGPIAQNVGDVDKAIPNAVTKIEATYQVPCLAHARMEPMNCTVHVRNYGCEVWVGSQVIARAQAAAKTAGMPLDKVLVHNHLIGGGFGRRLEADGVMRAVDCGTVFNPDTVRAQIRSAIMFGITASLYGEITLKDGRVEQTNFDTYEMLRMNEVPAIEVHIVQSFELPGGMGEAGTSAIVPAVTNAIFAATGKRLRKLPIDTAALKQRV